jgi:hypothetical protein
MFAGQGLVAHPTGPLAVLTHTWVAGSHVSAPHWIGLGWLGQLWEPTFHFPFTQAAVCDIGLLDPAAQGYSQIWASGHPHESFAAGGVWGQVGVWQVPWTTCQAPVTQVAESSLQHA